MGATLFFSCAILSDVDPDRKVVGDEGLVLRVYRFDVAPSPRRRHPTFSWKTWACPGSAFPRIAPSFTVAASFFSTLKSPTKTHGPENAFRRAWTCARRVLPVASQVASCRCTLTTVTPSTSAARLPFVEKQSKIAQVSKTVLRASFMGYLEAIKIPAETK